MYFIVNLTKHEVSISDLGISIGPKKSMDLEKIKSTSDILDSKDLKNCIKKGIIQVRHDSTYRSSKQPHSQPTIVHSSIDSEQIEKIREAVADEMRKHPIQQAAPQSASTEELIKLIAKLNEKIETLSGNRASSEKSNEISYEKESELNEDTLSDIHAKKMSKIGKGSKSNLSYEQKSVADSVSDRASELEGLL